MVTHKGAEALGILETTGTIEVGKRADVLVLGSDPSLDIRNAIDIEQIFLGGVPVAPHSEARLPGPS
jgi:imidazolonepropionase-like amidohydrolase